ncbi:MAG: peroxiredoxin-like family protein [Sandaracinaceae bacterium]
MTEPRTSDARSHVPKPIGVGDRLPARDLATLTDEPVRVPDPRRLVHLQLRRFAGCPICSLHLRAFARRHDELIRERIVEVAVFHSSATELRKVHVDLPFAVIPDPEKRLYAELGVGTSLRALLHPSAWAAAARAAASFASKDPTAGMGDGSFGLPGDFLIAPDGTILALKRGSHADDQWSFDELLAHARATRRA